MNPEYFRYFLDNYNGMIYRINVDKKNNIYKESMAWYYKAGDWEIIDTQKTLGWIWTDQGGFDKFYYRKNYKIIRERRKLEAIKIIKDTNGKYTEGTWEDMVLELL